METKHNKNVDTSMHPRRWQLLVGTGCLQVFPQWGGSAEAYNAVQDEVC